MQPEMHSYFQDPEKNRGEGQPPTPVSQIIIENGTQYNIQHYSEYSNYYEPQLFDRSRSPATCNPIKPHRLMVLPYFVDLGTGTSRTKRVTVGIFMMLLCSVFFIVLYKVSLTKPVLSAEVTFVDGKGFPTKWVLGVPFSEVAVSVLDQDGRPLVDREVRVIMNFDESYEVALKYGDDMNTFMVAAVFPTHNCSSDSRVSYDSQAFSDYCRTAITGDRAKTDNKGVATFTRIVIRKGLPVSTMFRLLYSDEGTKVSAFITAKVLMTNPVTDIGVTLSESPGAGKKLTVNADISFTQNASIFVGQPIMITVLPIDGSSFGPLSWTQIVSLNEAPMAILDGKLEVGAQNANTSDPRRGVAVFRDIVVRTYTSSFVTIVVSMFGFNTAMTNLDTVELKNVVFPVPFPSIYVGADSLKEDKYALVISNANTLTNRVTEGRALGNSAPVVCIYCRMPSGPTPCAAGVTLGGHLISAHLVQVDGLLVPLFKPRTLQDSIISRRIEYPHSITDSTGCATFRDMRLTIATGVNEHSMLFQWADIKSSIWSFNVTSTIDASRTQIPSFSIDRVRVGSYWNSTPTFRLADSGGSPIPGKQVSVVSLQPGVGVMGLSTVSNQEGWTYFSSISLIYSNVSGIAQFSFVCDNIVLLKVTSSIEYPVIPTLGTCAAVVVSKSTPNISITELATAGLARFEVTPVDFKGNPVLSAVQYKLLPTLDIVPPIRFVPAFEFERWEDYLVEPTLTESTLTPLAGTSISLGDLKTAGMYSDQMTITLGFRCAGSTGPFAGRLQVTVYSDAILRKGFDGPAVVEGAEGPREGVFVRYTIISSPLIHFHAYSTNYFYRRKFPNGINDGAPWEVKGNEYFNETDVNGTMDVPMEIYPVHGYYFFYVDSIYGTGIHVATAPTVVRSAPQIVSEPQMPLLPYTMYSTVLSFAADPTRDLDVGIALLVCDPGSLCTTPALNRFTRTYIKGAVSLLNDSYVISRPLTPAERTSGTVTLEFCVYGVHEGYTWFLVYALGGESATGARVVMAASPKTDVEDGQTIGSQGSPIATVPKIKTYIGSALTEMPTVWGLVLFPIDDTDPGSAFSAAPRTRRIVPGLPMFDYFDGSGASSVEQLEWIISRGCPSGTYTWVISTPSAFVAQGEFTVTREPRKISVDLNLPFPKVVEVGAGIAVSVTVTAGGGVPIVSFPVTCAIRRVATQGLVLSAEWKPYPGECYGAGCGIGQPVPRFTDNKGRAKVSLQVLAGAPGLYRVICLPHDGKPVDFTNQGISDAASEPFNATQTLQDVFLQFAVQNAPQAALLQADVFELKNRVAKVIIERQPVAYSKSPVGVPSSFKFAGATQYGQSEAKLKTPPRIRVVDSNGNGLSGRRINIVAFPSKKRSKPALRAWILTNPLKRANLQLSIRYDETRVSDVNGYVDYPSFTILKGDGKKTAREGNYVLVFWADGVPSEPSKSFSVKFVNSNSNSMSQLIALIAILCGVPLLWSTIPGSKWILIITSPFVLACCIVVIAVVFMRDAVQIAQHSKSQTAYVSILLAGLSLSFLYVIITHLHFYYKAFIAHRESKRLSSEGVDIFQPPSWYIWMTDCDVALIHYNYAKWLFNLRINKTRKVGEAFPDPPKEYNPFFYPTRFLIAVGVCIVLVTFYIAVSVRLFIGFANTIDTLNQRFANIDISAEEASLVENAITQNIATALLIGGIPSKMKATLNSISQIVANFPLIETLIWIQEILRQMKTTLRIATGCALALALITITLNLVFLVRGCSGNMKLAARGYYRERYNELYTSSEAYIGLQTLHFVVGFLIQFFLYLIVILVVITPSIISVIFEAVWRVVLTLIVSTLVRLILVQLVEKFLLNGMHYRYPLIYHMWSVIDSIFSCLAAPTAAIGKVVLLLFSYVMFFARLDWLIFPRRVLVLDAGHRAYVAMQVAHNYHQNALGKLFSVYLLMGRCDINTLQPHIRNMMLLVLADRKKVPFQMQSFSRRIMRKWHLCVLLVLNPSLVKYRKAALPIPSPQIGLVEKIKRKLKRPKAEEAVLETDQRELE